MAFEESGKALLSDVALAAAWYAPRAGDWPICGFLPSVGWSYDRRLMVMGRAPNGWSQGWTADELSRSVVADRFAHETLAGVREPVDAAGPMTWVSTHWGNTSGYNTARSAFWRVSRAVQAALSDGASDRAHWSDELAWSNLYKLAPAEGGNPSEILCRLQFASCLRMFRQELSGLWPRHLLILAGWDWARPFVESLCDWSPTASQVEAIGRYVHKGGSTTRIVVAPHPQGLSEEPLVERICEAFAQLNEQAGAG